MSVTQNDFVISITHLNKKSNPNGQKNADNIKKTAETLFKKVCLQVIISIIFFCFLCFDKYLNIPNIYKKK
jgi:hypothetical protein